MCTNLTLLMKSTQCASIITPFAFIAIMVMLIQLLASTCKEEEEEDGDFEGDMFVELSYKSKTTQQRNYVHDSMVNAFHLNNYICLIVANKWGIQNISKWMR